MVLWYMLLFHSNVVGLVSDIFFCVKVYQNLKFSCFLYVYQVFKYNTLPPPPKMHGIVSLATYNFNIFQGHAPSPPKSARPFQPCFSLLLYFIGHLRKILQTLA